MKDDLDIDLKKDNRKIAIYARKSKATERGESIDNQIDNCKRWVQFNMPETNYDFEIYEDEGFTGANTNRPKFQQLLKDIENGLISCVVVYRLDRISRNLKDFNDVVDYLKTKDVSFRSVSEKFDTSTPVGNATMQLISVFAEFERNIIAERIIDNMYGLAKTGRWLGGTTPTGFSSESITSRVTVDGKDKIAYKLIPIPQEIEIVKMIFNKFIETQSLTQVETFLLNNNIKTKNGVDYSRFSIKSILMNPVYLTADKNAFKYFFQKGCQIFSSEDDFDGKYGLMVYNKTEQQKGKKNKIRDYDKWIIAIGKHEPIISSNDWIKANFILSKNSRKSYRNQKTNTALLSGLLYCKECGSFMRPKLTQRENDKGERVYTYMCELKEKSRKGKCSVKNVRGNDLDRLICEEIKKLPNDKEAFTENIRNTMSKIQERTSEISVVISNNENKIIELEKQITNLIGALSNKENDITDAYIRKKIENNHKEIARCRKIISDNMEAQEQNEGLIFEYDNIEKKLSDFSSTVDLLNYKEKIEVLKTFISKILWDGENVEILLNSNPDTEKIPFCGDRE